MAIPRTLLALLPGVVATAALGFLSIVLSGAGHGTYVPAALFFPYTMLLSFATGEIGPTGVALAVCQYPVYSSTLLRDGLPVSLLERRLIAIASLHLTIAALDIVALLLVG